MRAWCLFLAVVAVGCTPRKDDAAKFGGYFTANQAGTLFDFVGNFQRFAQGPFEEERLKLDGAGSGDECVLLEDYVFESHATPWFDAGELMVELAGGSVYTMDRVDAGGNIAYASPGFLPAAPGESVALQGFGGPDLGVFETTFTLPDQIALNEPGGDLGDVSLTGIADIAVGWQPVVGGSVMVQLDQALGVFPDEQTTRLLCRFADDGAASLPANLLSFFQPSDAALEDELRLFRVAGHTFTAPGAPGPIAIVGESSAPTTVRVTFVP